VLSGRAAVAGSQGLGLRRDGVAEVGEDTELGRADNADAKARTNLRVHQLPVTAGENAIG